MLVGFLVLFVFVKERTGTDNVYIMFLLLQGANGSAMVTCGEDKSYSRMKG